MKKLFILSIALIGLSSMSNAQILDSLQAGAASVQYQVVAPSNFEDFSATPYGQNLLFVSSRETSLFSKRDRGNNQRYFDLYLYDMKTGEVSRYGEELESLEKSKFHLGPATVLSDSAGVIISRNYQTANDSGDVNFYLIYENWATKEAYTLPFCSIANSYQHPFYDTKRRRLYFTSNMPGGPGGYDIYFSEFLKDNSWGDPVLVEGVNGPRDDVFPTISNDGTLYFSRTESQMNLNLFASKDDGITGFHAPVSTALDEFSLIELNKDSAVFSQSQEGGFNTDLVMAWIETDGIVEVQEQVLTVYIPVPEGADAWELEEEYQSKWPANDITVGQLNGELVILVQESVKNAVALETQAKSTSMNINVDLTTETIHPVSRPLEKTVVVNESLDEDGAFTTIVGVFTNVDSARRQLERVKEWAPDSYIAFRKGRYYVVSEGYRNEKDANKALMHAKDNGIATAWLLPERLSPIPPSVLSSSPDLVVYFKFDQSAIQEKYQRQISDAITELAASEVNNVYIVGHTDARGTKGYNYALGLKRVEEVEAYISRVHQELDTDRELESCGERQLINDCIDGKECDEYSHFLNRRVEIWFY